MNTDLKNQIINALGLANLAPAEQEAALDKVGGLLLEGVLTQVALRLNEADQDALGKIIEAEPVNEQELFSFLETKVPDLGEVIKGEVARFKGLVDGEGA